MLLSGRGGGFRCRFRRSHVKHETTSGCNRSGGNVGGGLLRLKNIIKINEMYPVALRDTDILQMFRLSCTCLKLKPITMQSIV